MLALALASRKAQGRKLGNPINPHTAAAIGRQSSVREADRFAASVLPIIRAIQATGASSLRSIAISLNNRGIRTARGGAWQVSNVRNVLKRTGAAL